MHGEGVYLWKNGNEYRGNYKNDLKHGKGIYIVPNEYGNSNQGLSPFFQSMKGSGMKVCL